MFVSDREEHTFASLCYSFALFSTSTTLIRNPQPQPTLSLTTLSLTALSLTTLSLTTLSLTHLEPNPEPDHTGCNPVPNPVSPCAYHCAAHCA